MLDRAHSLQVGDQVLRRQVKTIFTFGRTWAITAVLQAPSVEPALRAHLRRFKLAPGEFVRFLARERSFPAKRALH